jgi:LPS export ABC transporter protein LptC
MQLLRIKSLNILLIGIAYGCLFLMASCVNDLASIERITLDSKSPDEVTKNLHVFYSDSGYAKIEVFAKLAETYHKPEEITKLRDGIKVNFFKDDGEIVSTLTALYGEVNMQKGTIFVQDSVQLFNIKKKQRLVTESLYWNQKDSSVYTNSSVSVSSPKGTLFGQGIRTKQDFSSYTFIKPYGKVFIEEGDFK